MSDLTINLHLEQAALDASSPGVLYGQVGQQWQAVMGSCPNHIAHSAGMISAKTEAVQRTDHTQKHQHQLAGMR